MKDSGCEPRRYMAHQQGAFFHGTFPRHDSTTFSMSGRVPAAICVLTSPKEHSSFPPVVLPLADGPKLLFLLGLHDGLLRPRQRRFTGARGNKPSRQHTNSMRLARERPKFFPSLCAVVRRGRRASRLPTPDPLGSISDLTQALSAGYSSPCAPFSCSEIVFGFENLK